MTDLELVMIAGYTRNRVLGSGGMIPWVCRDDLRYFRTATMGHAIIMGRRTWESLGGKPLPGRLNIVLSSRPSEAPWSLEDPTSTTQCVHVQSWEEALQVPGQSPQFCMQHQARPKIFVIGGGQLYKETLPLCKTLLLTEFDITVAGDTFFPHLSPDTWSLSTATHSTTLFGLLNQTPHLIPYHRLTYTRISR